LTAELVAAGLLLVIRVGLGRPNQYVLLGIAQEDLDGNAPKSSRSGSRASGGPAAGHAARPSYKVEEETKESGYIKPGKSSGYGRPARSSGDLMMTRHGPIPGRH
jgi:hypothetical protein